MRLYVRVACIATLIAAASAATTSVAHAQKVVTAQEASQHVGKPEIVLESPKQVAAQK